MIDGVLPVLWLCGPPGVGKSAVGWEIYSELVLAGIQTGYVDIDQLGMCYPETAADPGRHRMQARNLGGVVMGYRDAGARCVVVSGVVDASHGPHLDDLSGVALTVCRLRVDKEELIRRLVGRQGHAEGLAQALQEAADLDAGAVADVCVDTSGLTVAEAALRVRERAGGWPVLTNQLVAHRSGTDPRPYDRGSHESRVDLAGSVLWLCGATGVGKSTVGFQVYLKVLRAGLTAAYVDLEQLGFCGPTAAGHQVEARNLSAMWRTYREAGAQALVIVGSVEDASAVDVYVEAMPAATFTVCRLHAGRDQLTRRIILRGQGGGSWSQPGDPLVGQPMTRLLNIANRAAHDADALERVAIGHRIDTDGRTVEEIVEMVVAQTGWLGRAPA